MGAFLTGNEFVDYMRMIKKEGLVLKLDFGKAYDRVN